MYILTFYLYFILSLLFPLPLKYALLPLKYIIFPICVCFSSSTYLYACLFFLLCFYVCALLCICSGPFFSYSLLCIPSEFELFFLLCIPIEFEFLFPCIVCICSGKKNLLSYSIVILMEVRRGQFLVSAINFL